MFAIDSSREDMKVVNAELLKGKTSGKISVAVRIKAKHDDKKVVWKCIGVACGMALTCALRDCKIQ